MINKFEKNISVEELENSIEESAENLDSPESGLHNEGAGIEHTLDKKLSENDSTKVNDGRGISGDK